MSKVCVPGGQVPLRTLVRISDLRIFTFIDGFARLEPPHGRASLELNPMLNRGWEPSRTSSSFLSAATHAAYGLRVSARSWIACRFWRCPVTTNQLVLFVAQALGHLLIQMALDHRLGQTP
jgi:hypothetical protein